MPQTNPFDRISRQWQNRADRSREYEVIRDGNVFGTGLHDSYLFRSEYDRARLLLQQLMEEYRDATLDDLFLGRDCSSGKGTCYAVSTRANVEFSLQDRTEARQAILSDLSLIRGIGRKTGDFLKRRGYRTIADLVHHPKFGKEAKRLLAEIEEEEAGCLMQRIGCWHPRSHPLAFKTCGFFDQEDFIFFDIETLGLFSRPIVLFGVAQVTGGEIAVHQYLVRDIGEEETALAATLGHLSGAKTALVTFNGRSFDVPYLHDRLAYYGIPDRLAMPHYDLLHFSRRIWKGMFSDCRLVTLERELFGHSRTDDVPSQMVPEFYEAYQRTGNVGPLVPVVEHNRQDVITLARLFSRIQEEWNGS